MDNRPPYANWMAAARKVCCCMCSNELLCMRAVFPSPPRWKIDLAGRGRNVLENGLTLEHTREDDPFLKANFFDVVQFGFDVRKDLLRDFTPLLFSEQIDLVIEMQMESADSAVGSVVGDGADGSMPDRHLFNAACRYP